MSNMGQREREMDEICILIQHTKRVKGYITLVKCEDSFNFFLNK